MPSRLSAAATTVQRHADRIPVPLRFPLMVYAVLQVIYLLWWAAFYPGLMSYDSITYVREVTEHHWSSDHSVLYDALVWLSLKGTGDLWLLTLLQAIAVSAVLAYTCVALRDLGVRARWSFAAAVVLAVLPSTGTFTVFVWKDSAFAISVLLAFAALIRLTVRVVRGRDRLRERWFYWQLGLLELGFIGIALFRNSSITVVLVALPVMLLALRSMRIWITAMAVATTVLYLGMNFVVYPHLGILKPNVTSYYAFNYADIAVAYHDDPKSFTPADRAVMEKVSPLATWGGRAGNCWNVDWTMHALDRPALAAENTELMDLWWRVVGRTPNLVAQGHLCRSQIAWGIFGGPKNLAGNTQIADPYITADLFHQAAPGRAMEHSRYLPVLRTRPLSDPLHAAAEWFYRFSETPQTQWLVWRGAIWAYLSYLSVGLLAYRWRRQARRLFVIAGMALGVQLSVVIANPSPMTRYTLPITMVGIMTVPLLGLLRRPAPQSDPSPPAPVQTPVPTPLPEKPARTENLAAASTPRPSRIGTS